MRVKHVLGCLWCGIRPGAVRSAFCTRDAKRVGIKLIDERHRMHFFRKSKLVDGWYGMPIVDQLRELK